MPKDGEHLIPAAGHWASDEVEGIPVEDERFTTISSGNRQTCALREDGSDRCWGPMGVSSRFRLLDEDRNFLEDARFIGISVGTLACGLHENGSIACWSSGFWQPFSPPEGHRFEAVGVGHDDICAIRDDGALICWAWSYDDAVVLDDGPINTISAGYDHICGLHEDGSPVCWGDNSSGQTSPPESENFAAISSGEDHTCALRKDGSPVCWGWSDFGQASPP